MKKLTKQVDLLGKLIKEQDKLKSLPPLTELDRATFEHSRDIEHLYFSSKIEGSNLTRHQIDKAIHGAEI